MFASNVCKIGVITRAKSLREGILLLVWCSTEEATNSQVVGPLSVVVSACCQLLQGYQS